MDRLLEREDERTRLAAACDAAALGSGAAVLVEGPAGIGKTSLLALTGELATTAGLRVARARGAELDQALGFGVVRDLLARLVARAPAAVQGRIADGAGAVALPALGLAPASDVPADEAGVRHGLTWLVSPRTRRWRCWLTTCSGPTRPPRHGCTTSPDGWRTCRCSSCSPCARRAARPSLRASPRCARTSRPRACIRRR
ncbi:MAG TPA: ATP-binding protein [Baekduia sp.]|nr:ATP-binding protein [Baekduia sp.]